MSRTLRLTNCDDIFTPEQLIRLAELDAERVKQEDVLYNITDGKEDLTEADFKLFVVEYAKAEEITSQQEEILDAGWSAYANKFYHNEEDILKDVAHILDSVEVSYREVKDQPLGRSLTRMFKEDYPQGKNSIGEETIIDTLKIEWNCKTQYYVCNNVATFIGTDTETANQRTKRIDEESISDHFISYTHEILEPIYREANERNIPTRNIDIAIVNRAQYFFDEEGEPIREHLTAGTQITLDLFPEGIADNELTIPDNVLRATWIKPQNYVMTKDKATRTLTRLESGKRTKLNRGKDKRGVDVDTYVTIINEVANINPFVRSVFWALCTEWEAGNTVTTAEKIQQILAKNQNTRLYVNDNADQEAQYLKIIDACNTLNHTQIILNAEEEYNAYSYPDLVAQTKQGSVASISVETAFINGRLTKDTIHILDLNKSPLYWYAKATGEITTTPFRLLEEPADNKGGKRAYKRVNTTDESTAIQEYLIYRIEAIPELSHSIRLDAVLKEANIHEEDYKDFKQKVKAVRGNVESLLDRYKRTGYLKSWDRSYNGRTIVGWKVYPPRTHKSKQKHN